MIAANVSAEDQNTTSSLDLNTIRRLATDTANSLQDLDIDHLGALAVSLCPFHELKLGIAGVLHLLTKE